MEHNVKGIMGDQEQEWKDKKPTGQKTYMIGTGTPRVKGLHRQTRRWDRLKAQWEGTLRAPTIREGAGTRSDG